MFQELWRGFREGFVDAFRLMGRAVKRVFGRLGLAVGDISAGRWVQIALALPLVFFAYILIGMPIQHRIDTETDLDRLVDRSRPIQSVEVVMALIRREARDHNWTPNDPFFVPGFWLDNMPNFQRGMMGAVSRFTFELRDQLGRQRGSSASDADLETAAGNLAIEADRWVIDFSSSWLPTRPSDGFYREGAARLQAYSERFASGEAVFDRRADNLLATLDRVALDLGASSAALDDYIARNAGGIGPDVGVDNLFYRVKGQVYAYVMILKALRRDFAKIIAEKELDPMMDALIASLEKAARLDPWLVTNGAIDGLWANHLSIQGFYLLRARTQLREVTSILLA